MALADDILELVARRSHLTEAEIASALFGATAYQQRVNSTCRRLIRQGQLKRYGQGGATDPFTYTMCESVNRG